MLYKTCATVEEKNYTNTSNHIFARMTLNKTTWRWVHDFYYDSKNKPSITFPITYFS